MLQRIEAWRVIREEYLRSKVYVNGLEGFWSFARQRPAGLHDVSKEKFPLYLKAMELRFNP